MEKKQKTKEIILEKATEIFLKRGFNGARMQEIADVAKVNKAAIHYYYSSKEELFKIVFKNSFKKLFLVFDELVNTDIEVLKKIYLFIDNYFDFVEANIKNFHFIINSLDKNENFVQEITGIHSIKEGFLDKIMAEIEEDMKIGKLKKYPVKHLWFNIISMVVFPMLAQKIIKIIGLFSDEELSYFLEERKEMIKLFIKKSIEKEE